MIRFLVWVIAFLLFWAMRKDEEAKQREIATRYETRIKELEERLCPCQSHDWRRTDFEFTGGTGRGDETTLYHYQCSRCGKKTVTYKILD